ncbi:MAG: trigger factor, partial [Clostridia bacterium]|nr:trigger factor [Clostridia bacterium]
ARERQARFVEVEREAKNGDFVVIDFSGSVDGVKFDGGTAEDYRLELGSHTFIEGFEDQLVGMKVGETKDVNVTFPEEYHAENLKGKPAVFECKLKKVEEKQLPELNDEFASNVSDFETLDEYKADIRKHLEENLKMRLERENENNLIEAVVKGSTVEVPEVLVERQLDMFMQDFSYRLAYQGIKFEDYLKYANVTEKELRDERREQATETAKTRLVLEALVKKEGLEVSAEELDAKLLESATKYKKSLEDYKKSMGEKNIAYVENDILMKKLLKLLTENNKLV